MKRILTIINLTLITAVVYMGVHIFYKLMEAKLDGIPIVDTYQPPSATAESNPIPSLSSYKAITQRNLFKIQNEKPKTPAKPVAISHRGFDSECIGEDDIKTKGYPLCGW